ncbi:MAG: hypothetical protein OEV28_03285 [Nitrospirota bacterium]|nr:hypothetical protein [Nitrospirota bacterium]
MTRSYQRLEELEEQPRFTRRESAAKGMTPSVKRIIVFSLLVVALGASLFYAARMRDSVDATRALAEKTKKEALAMHQQIKVIEGERDSLSLRVNELTALLHKTQAERDQLTREVESLKKARTVPAKPDSKKARKRA